jgi:hypothetical protein
MKILDPQLIVVTRHDSGFLNLTFDGKTYCNVRFRQLFPVSDPGNYVEIEHVEGDSSLEIGIIRSVSDLEEPFGQLVRNEIGIAYFVPEIRAIVSIEKFKGARGLETWTVDTDKGKKAFSIKADKENFAVHDNGVIHVTDSGQCRYKIINYQRFPKKMREHLEKYLP